MKDLISIPKEEYELLVDVVLLLSDARLAEINEGFKNEMNVDPRVNRHEADKLVTKWENL